MKYVRLGVFCFLSLLVITGMTKGPSRGSAYHSSPPPPDVGAAFQTVPTPTPVADAAEWQKNVAWSWSDSGFCEGPVQAEIQRLDLVYKKNMYVACIRPGTGAGGRACVMQKFACDAVRHKFDHMAWEMTIATQLHNPHAADTIRAAGETAVADYMRNALGCK